MWVPRTTTAANHLRRDAQRNRAAIVAAARELLTDSREIPMQRIAVRSGVGQATLYRHFADRDALAAAVIGEEIERVVAVTAPYREGPEAFFVVLRALLDGMVHLYGLAEVFRGDLAGDSPLTPRREEVTRLIDESIREAGAAGGLRQDVSVDDAFFLLLMAAGALEHKRDANERAVAAHRFSTLVLGDGIRAPRRSH